jgi:Kef-type K+ transport system membrane component KefB
MPNDLASLCNKWITFLWQNPVADIYSIIWKVFRPVLFGLIGTETDLSQLKETTVPYGLCVLAIGHMVSMLIMQALLENVIYLENW